LLCMCGGSVFQANLTLGIVDQKHTCHPGLFIQIG